VAEAGALCTSCGSPLLCPCTQPNKFGTVTIPMRVPKRDIAALTLAAQQRRMKVHALVAQIVEMWMVEQRREGLLEEG
jgi:hypothetical protein